jgi:hypothetical protein
LNALVWLGISSALAFGAVVTVAVAAKGCSGRARHLTMVEAGAGMTRGTARRWRGFFVPGAREMTIRTPSSSGVLGTEVTSHGDRVGDVLRIDHDGLRLADMGLRPWETLVIREDGYADLGAGISLLRTSDSETEVVNKSGRRLLGVVLWQPVTGGRYLRSLDDGATVSSRDFASVSITVSHGAPPWELRDFNMHAIHREFDTASVDLALAWSAVVDAIPERKDWFPRDVPVLLAQLDGGEGESQDSGLRIDSDRVLIRVVGYGGTP